VKLMQRLLVLVCLLAVATACGFRPRASLALAADLGPVKVSTSDPYSPLGQGLSVALARAGATPAAEGQPAAVLRVRSESMGTRPLALDRLAQVREYETTYRVGFDLVGADGAERVPLQQIELSREYTYDSVASAGSPAEQALIQEELRREMQAAILRRLDAMLRAD
jgi:LPS-assembly lipoprotein